MHIAIFSYNRGWYLRNCLDSIQRHADHARVTVFDDNSSDPEVHRALADYASLVETGPAASRGTSAYLGGLYSNMQRAIDIAEPLVLFMQDDMQLVRDIGVEDEAHWQRYFEYHPDSQQIYTCFIKREQATSGRPLVEIDRATPAYIRSPASGRRAYFSAVGLFHAERMRLHGWTFELSEGENNEKARRAGLHLGMTPWPFMMWLPNAKSSKFRKRGALERFAEWWTGAGFYPYRALGYEQLEWLRSRPLDELPVAEHLLSPVGLNSAHDWLFEDATKAIKPLHRHLKKRKKKEIRERRKRESSERQ